MNDHLYKTIQEEWRQQQASCQHPRYTVKPRLPAFEWPVRHAPETYIPMEYDCICDMCQAHWTEKH